MHRPYVLKKAKDSSRVCACVCTHEKRFAFFFAPHTTKRRWQIFCWEKKPNSLNVILFYTTAYGNDKIWSSRQGKKKTRTFPIHSQKFPPMFLSITSNQRLISSGEATTRDSKSPRQTEILAGRSQVEEAEGRALLRRSRHARRCALRTGSVAPLPVGSAVSSDVIAR